MTQKVLIIEDEKLNGDRISRLLLEIRPTIHILAVLPSVKKVIQWFNENESPDVILMDIQLADGLSFEVFNIVDISCPVIFTTAYEEYAIKAFKYNSIDYLLKPIIKTELEDAFRKLERTTKKPYDQFGMIENLLAYMQIKNYRQRFLIPYRDGYHKVSTKDIAFFKSLNNITFAHLYSGESLIVSNTLEVLVQELDPKDFFRVNRQYIVHMDAIQKVHNFFNGKLKLNLRNYPNEGITVSRNKAPEFKAWMDF